MKLIGFNGKMGVGKSTAVACLREASLNSVRLVKFAQPLYDMQEYIYRRIQGTYRRPDGFTKDRKLLQWIGTEWGRDSISPTLWVDIWKKEVEYQQLNQNNIVICDDVRFDNEAEAIKAMGGIVINISANNTEKRIDTKSGIVQHSSEAGIKPELIDCRIDNNGSLSEFLKKLTDAYKEFGIIPNNKKEQANV